MPTAHYDGVAAWYDEHLSPGPEVTDVARRLARPGPGSCLDLGWTVTGIDISEDQLGRLALRASR